MRGTPFRYAWNFDLEKTVEANEIVLSLKVKIFSRCKTKGLVQHVTVSIFGNFCPKIIFQVKSSRFRLIYHQNHHWHTQVKFEHVSKISQISLNFTF